MDRTADHVPATGSKVAWVRISNCVSEEPGCAIFEIERLQEMNTRARADRSYHLVVSFPAGERPTRDQFEAIEDEICAGLGYAGHQRLSAVHTNTDNLHIHIAINRVHPVTLRCIEPYYDHRELAGLCRRLEAKHALRPDNHIGAPTLSEPARTGASGEGSMLNRTPHPVGKVPAECRATGAGWQDLHAVLERYGLEIRPDRGGPVIGWTGFPWTGRAGSVDRELLFETLSGCRGEERRWTTNLLRVGNADEAGAGTSSERPSATRQDGDRVYRTADGGVVVDETTRIRVEQVTTGASFLALALAESRFGGRALIVEGGTVFRDQVVQLAALKGMNLRFADPALERERQRLAALHRGPSPPIAEEVMTERDSSKPRLSTIGYQKDWTQAAADGGVARGYDSPEESSDGVPLKRGHEVPAKPAGAIRQEQIGRAVEPDAGGRSTGRTRARRN